MVVTVNVEEPDVTIVPGLKLAVAPGMFCTPSEARVTVPVNFNGTIMGVKVTLCPRVTV